MKVTLAGFNVDVEVLERLNSEGKEILTPETFSAAYARISRSKDDVAILRRRSCSDVASARRSNRRIVFDMGHHSVAEHAVFNFDVSGISRLALEMLEKFRLVSFTEKSQRYVLIDGPVVIPDEISAAEDRLLFKQIAAAQFAAYQKGLTCIREYLQQEGGSTLSTNQLEERAKEDARYFLPLASEAQLGMTINARNLEHLLRRFQEHELAEIRELGRLFLEQSASLAPSIVLFTAPSAFDRNIGRILFMDTECQVPVKDSSWSERIISCPAGGDDLILAGLAFTRHGCDFSSARASLNVAEKKRIYLELFREMEFYDRPPREFELVEVVFEAVVSASCFAQLKRHRMATLLVSDYEPRLGNTMPEIFSAAGIEEDFHRLVARCNEAYDRLRERYCRAAVYQLSNSHRRRVLVKMNLREIYHFSRLREDEHAQWEIRRLAAWLSAETRNRLPLAGMMLGGKSDFQELRSRLAGKLPRNRGG